MDALIFKDGKKVFQRKSPSFQQLTDIQDAIEVLGFSYKETRWLTKFAFETDFVNESGEKVTLTFV